MSGSGREGTGEEVLAQVEQSGLEVLRWGRGACKREDAGNVATQVNLAGR